MSTLSLYMGRSGTGKSYACYERIKEIIETNPEDQVILLVPDPATYKTERDLAEFMPNGGFTTVRIVGFGRLAYQIFQSTGKVHAEGLSDIGQKLLLRLIMKRDADKLDILSPVAKQAHFADTMQTLMAECEAFQITPAILKNGANSDLVHSQTLKRKLSALADLMGSYKDMVSTMFGEYKSPFEELIEILPTSPLLKDAHIFIDGFHWFTPLQFELVQTLINQAKEAVLTITMPVDAKGKEASHRKGALFSRSREVYDEVQKVYADKGIPVEEVHFTENKRFQSAEIEALAEGFFAIPAISNPLNSNVNPLLQAYNREREADAVCRKILGLMEAEPKRRWKDFTIMLRESETYGDVLEKSLRRYEIPFFSDRRNPMLTHPLAEFLSGLLEIVSRRFNHDAMFRLLKTDFFPVERLAVDEMENYCLEFGVRDFMWLRSEWPYKHKEWEQAPSDETVKNSTDVLGIDADFIEDSGVSSEVVSEVTTTPEEEYRLRINVTHDMVMALLRPWWEFAKKDHTGAEWCDELYQMILRIGIPERLSQWSDEAEAQGNMQEMMAHEQMFKKVISFFDEVHKVGHDEILSLEELSVLLEEGLADVTYSLVPPSLDHVTITTIERGYTRESKIVFVMGLNEGIFPQRMGDEGILKDQERRELQEAGITLAAGSLVRSFNEQFLFYLACTRAEEKLYLSYAQSDAEGAKQEPSLLVKRLIQLGYCDDFNTPNGKSEVVPLLMEDGTEADYLWRFKQSMSLLAGQFGALAKGSDIAKFDSALWFPLYEWTRTTSGKGDALARLVRGVLAQNDVPLIDQDVVTGLFLRDKSITGSVTRIERYQACPFSFYSQYGLKLEPRKVKQLGAPEIGSFLHENLRAIGEELLQKNKRWADLNDVERKEICERASKELSSELLGLGDYLNSDVAVPEEEKGDDQILLETMKGRLEATLERTVRRLGIWSENSKFNTAYLEQGFGHGPKSPWAPIYVALDNGNSVRLQGQIDRIDEYTTEDGEKYGMIIDYKSGRAHVSSSDIYYGLKLQLITYLMALEKNEPDVKPAAIIYTPVKNPRIPIKGIISENLVLAAVDSDKSLTNSGYFLADIDRLGDIDHRFFGGSTEFVPIRNTSKGIHGRDKWKTKSLEEFETLTNYSTKIIYQAGTDILAGKFPISPYNKGGRRPCEYCKYKNICRFEKVDGTNTYRYIEKLKEDVGISKMEGGEVYGMDSTTTSSH